MITDYTILAVEIGYVVCAAAIAQSARFVAVRIARARTASGIRKMLRVMAPESPAVPDVTGYRDNVAVAVEAEECSPGFVERWRAKRAATYVHELERRAKIDA